MHISSRQDRLHAFMEACRRQNLKITPQRIAVYKALMDNTRHPSADDVFQRVRKDFPRISFDTVNRTLLTFTEAGLIHILETPGGPRRFDPDTSSHHHFHCIRCGRIIDFCHDLYDKLELPEEMEKEFRILKKTVVITGYCDRCRGSESAS